jgi:ATP adenylyltransferase
MQYVGGGTREEGCVFCNRLAENDDVQSLILHRGPRTFTIMNLFPYNTGHAMILPNDHVASPEELDDDTAIEMARSLPVLLAAIRRALAPGGFNVGMNLGSIAGAGIAAHLHQHVVPRWQGDANFMPILANTKALPELIPVTYAKIRAELERGTAPVPLVALTAEQDRVFVERDPDGALRLPLQHPDAPEALWSAGQAALARAEVSAFFTGWAGQTRAEGASSAALAYQIASAPEPALVPVSEIPRLLPIADQTAVEQALRHLRA